jgi:thioredoxin reductase
MQTDGHGAPWDCLIVGAGPAGLNAALVLGRARRRVLVLDHAEPRNAATHEMHGVLGHDGRDPADLRARGRDELGRYGVDVVTAEVTGAGLLDGEVRLVSDRGTEVSRTVLLATGMLDELPDVPGFADVWGTSAHTCPYCDGFEHRDERLAVFAAGARGEHLAVLEGGETLDRDALFFFVGWHLRNDLARTLGCQLNDDKSVVVNHDQATTVDRVYAVGNCAEPRALVPAAAGSGVTAAVAINARLSFEDADQAVADSRSSSAIAAR